ncbi:hypothetical protein AH06_125 [Erwinia phage AH06]|nr:hypothetical protein AH06_125 [Erwinia phage AH06]
MIGIGVSVCFRLRADAVDPFLVGVCNYDILVTEERIAGLLKELEGMYKRVMFRYHHQCEYKLDGKVLEIVMPFIPNAFEGKLAPAITVRIPKDVNYAVNGCMKETHEVLYPLTKVA